MTLDIKEIFTLSKERKDEIECMINYHEYYMKYVNNIRDLESYLRKKDCEELDIVYGLCFMENSTCRSCMSSDNSFEERETLLETKNCFKTDCPLFGYNIPYDITCDKSN